MALTRVVKTFALDQTSLQENAGTGAAAAIGNLDRGKDVILPGAFALCTPDFLASGFISDSHDWSKQIGMPKSAAEQGRAYNIGWEFHSTPDAQIIRQKCVERLANKLSVGLSIGFGMSEEDFKVFANGKALLAWAKSLGCDMSLLDVAAIEAHKGWCRAIKTIRELYETAICAVPMNPAATATAVKRHNTESEGRDMPTETRVVTKSEYLGDVERSATCDALYTYSGALHRLIYKSLYGAETDSAEEVATSLEPAFDEHKALCLSTIKALCESVDMSAEQERAHYYYDYYSLPPAEMQAMTLGEKASALATATGAFCTLLSRRQEVRVKAGRKLSAATQEKLTEIHGHLSEAVGKLSEMMASSDDDDSVDPGDETAKSAMELQADLWALEAEMMALSAGGMG